MSRKPVRMPSGKRVILPPGFELLPSGTLRVRLRLKGHDPIVRNFPLFSASVEAELEQMAAARAWAEETRRKLLLGTHVSSREVETTSLGTALIRYRDEGLRGKESNVLKDRRRINAILRDPIAERPLVKIRKTALAEYRDLLVRRGWEKSIARAVAELEQKLAQACADLSIRSEIEARLADLRTLPTYRDQLKDAKDSERKKLELQISSIEGREGIKGPARTTVVNQVQLISRALKFMGQFVDGVPEVTGVPMPQASPGRSRRVTDAELKLLLEEAPKIHYLLPLIIRFAIATALRRERILEFRLSYLVEIGSGQKAIKFPLDPDGNRRKPVGIVPVTQEIQSIVDTANAYNQGNALQKDLSVEQPLFDIVPATFENHWKKLLRVTKVRNLHFHDLRHEATSRLFESGLSAIEVGSVTGHSTNEMLDRYAHYSAAIVGKKLERGNEPLLLLEEIAFLISQYRAASGNMAKVAALLV